MSKIIIQIDSPETIYQLNDEVQETSNNPQAAIQKIMNYLKGALVGSNNGLSIQVTVRDTTVTVATSGTGSTQNTHTI